MSHFIQYLAAFAIGFVLFGLVVGTLAALFLPVPFILAFVVAGLLGGGLCWFLIHAANNGRNW